MDLDWVLNGWVQGEVGRRGETERKREIYGEGKQSRLRLWCDSQALRERERERETASKRESERVTSCASGPSSRQWAVNGLPGCHSALMTLMVDPVCVGEVGCVYMSVLFVQVYCRSSGLPARPFR